jgi:hypothetical protein
MNDQIKFSCLSCGQHIECDVTESGRPMLCPSYHANLTVPLLMEQTPAPAPDPNAVQAETLPPPPPPVSPRTSGLAVASLVCGLLSPVICFGCLAGIICGHLARRAIRRNPILTGKGVATAGLIISYAALVLLVAFAVFIFKRGADAFKETYNEAHSFMDTNSPVPVVMQTNVNEAGPAQSSNVSGTGTGSGWTLDVRDVTIPGGGVSGTIHGSNFQLKRAIFRNGNLKFLSMDGQESVLIYNLGQSIENKSMEFQTASANDNDAPKIEIGWKDQGENKTETFQDGYAMELKFAAAKGRRIRGQIYLCLPDDSKSYIAGSFTVILPKPKPSPQPTQ